MVASIWLTPELNQTKMVYVIGRHYCQKTRLSRLSKLPPPYDMFSFSRDALSAGDGSVLTITKPSSRTPNLHVVRTVIDNLTLRTTTNWFNKQALYEPLKMV